MYEVFQSISQSINLYSPKTDIAVIYLRVSRL